MKALRAIVIFTQTGTTARLVSKQRPRAPIFAFTPDEKTRRAMSLYWNVHPGAAEFNQDVGSLVAAADRLLIKAGAAKRGDLVIVVAGSSPVPGATNMMKVHEVGSEAAT